MNNEIHTTTDMKKILLSIAFLATATISWALEVDCTPGNLADLVSNKTFTSLKITGSMDARDFKFINDSLDHVTSFDLSQVNIVAFHTSKPLFANEIDYLPNTIPAMAFFDKSVTSVMLPTTLQTIGMAAFAGCNSLKSISFPEGLDSIADYAFSASGLIELTLPTSIRSIGEASFSNIPHLASATITPATSFTIGKRAFLGCHNLTSLTLGENVTAIDEGAFKGTTHLQQISFTGANNLKHIAKEAFVSSSIANFNFEEAQVLTDIGEWAFAQSKQVSAKMANATVNIAKGAFYYAPDLSSFIPGESLDTISEMMLAGTALTNDNILGNSVKHIGRLALYNVPTTKLTIPATVSYIGDNAMAGMTQLQELTTKATTVPELGEDVWAGVDQPNIPLYVPRASFEDYSNALQWQNFLVTIRNIFGDVNLDGYVTSADVTAVYDVLLGIDYTFEETADVNGDGYVTSADVTAIYNVLLGTQNVAGRNQVVNEDNDKLTADDFIIESGSTHNMSLAFDNSTAYCTMQLDLDMPQGLSIDKVSAANLTQGTTIGYNEIENGKWRILIINSSNQKFNANDNHLLNITVKAGDSFGGNEVITIDNVIAVEPCERSHLIGDLKVSVSNTTGVKDISIDDSNGPVDVYNMNGQMLRHNVDRDQATNGLPAGIYIIGGKKVIIK